MRCCDDNQTEKRAVNIRDGPFICTLFPRGGSAQILSAPLRSSWLGCSALAATVAAAAAWFCAALRAPRRPLPARYGTAPAVELMEAKWLQSTLVCLSRAELI